MDIYTIQHILVCSGNNRSEKNIENSTISPNQSPNNGPQHVPYIPMWLIRPDCPESCSRGHAYALRCTLDKRLKFTEHVWYFFIRKIKMIQIK